MTGLALSIGLPFALAIGLWAVCKVRQRRQRRTERRLVKLVAKAKGKRRKAA